MKTLFIIILSVITFSVQAQKGKERTDEALKSWIGSKEHDIILQLGSPINKTSDGADGNIITYSTTTYSQSQIPVGDNVFTFDHENVYFYEFYINSSDSVYSYRTNMKFSKKQYERIKKKEN